MDTSVITEEIIKEIILGSVSGLSEKYWIKSISRFSRTSIKGLTVEVAPIDENAGGGTFDCRI